MPIPERLRPPDIDPDELQQYCELLTLLEHAVESRDKEEIVKLREQWNARCQPREDHEFASYWKGTNEEDFVAEALLPVAELVQDLTFSEVVEIVDSVMSVELDEAHNGWCITWLEANFPNANPSDLIYWTDSWFGESGNQALLHLQLSSAQIVRYLCLASGRELPGTPTDIPLPHPLPERR